jgi:hypothetical protein
VIQVLQLELFRHQVVDRQEATQAPRSRVITPNSFSHCLGDATGQSDGSGARPRPRPRPRLWGLALCCGAPGRAGHCSGARSSSGSSRQTGTDLRPPNRTPTTDA